MDEQFLLVVSLYICFVCHFFMSDTALAIYAIICSDVIVLSYPDHVFNFILFLSHIEYNIILYHILNTALYQITAVAFLCVCFCVHFHVDVG